MFNIRNVKAKDLPALVVIESQCFSKEEAATKEAFKKRIQFIPDSFFVAEDHGEIIGLVNGPVISEPFITDDLFSEIKENPTTGGHQSILGVAVSPRYQGKGVAKALLFYLEEDAARRQRKSVTLTCKKNLILFYEKLGYENKGVSSSEHGGETWYNMTKELS